MIETIIIVGVERPYSQEEHRIIQEELFGEDWREHERMKAEGTLDDFELDFEPEDEQDLDAIAQQEPDDEDPDVEDIISQALYGGELDEE
jgi:hypothetical protein